MRLTTETLYCGVCHFNSCQRTNGGFVQCYMQQLFRYSINHLKTVPRLLFGLRLRDQVSISVMANIIEIVQYTLASHNINSTTRCNTIRRTTNDPTVINARDPQMNTLNGNCHNKLHSFDFFFFIISSSGGSKICDTVFTSFVFEVCVSLGSSVGGGGGGGGFSNVPTNLYFSEETNAKMFLF